MSLIGLSGAWPVYSAVETQSRFTHLGPVTLRMVKCQTFNIELRLAQTNKHIILHGLAGSQCVLQGDVKCYFN